MATLGKAIMGVAAALMLAGITTSAQAQVPGGVGSFGGEAKGVMQIKGSVVCVGCSLAEARAAQPERRNLIQLGHNQGQIVMEVGSVNDFKSWSHIATPRMWVRAEDGVFAKLTSEENLFKEVEITGILSKSRTLDIGRIMILG